MEEGQRGCVGVVRRFELFHRRRAEEAREATEARTRVEAAARARAVAEQSKAERRARAEAAERQRQHALQQLVGLGPDQALSGSAGELSEGSTN